MTDVEETHDKSPFDKLTTKSALVFLLFLAPVYFLFASLGDPGKGRAAAGCVGMIATAVWIRWDLRKRVWFWTTITILVLLHVPLIVFIPWTNTDYPGVVLLPLGLLDLAVVYGCIKLVEKLMKRNDEASTPG